MAKYLNLLRTPHRTAWERPCDALVRTLLLDTLCFGMLLCVLYTYKEV